MQSLPAPVAALFRFLEDERLDYCVLGDATAAGADGRIELAVATPVMERMPVLLRSFGAANDLELIERREAPDQVHIYRLSCISHEQHPQFLTVEVRADYLRCGRVVFAADDLLCDRVRAMGFAAIAPAKQFLCHLLRCVDTGGISASSLRAPNARSSAGTRPITSRATTIAMRSAVTAPSTQ